MHSSYPIEKPHSQGYLPVSKRHQIFYATYGNPQGIPVVVLHGGPGIGCSDTHTRFFDLNKWHVVMFDQRGAMRSKPFASMEENTPQHTITDMEALRELLGIKQWVLFGGSWGACLALLYAEEHPEACLGLILRGTFLAREQDISFFDDMEKKSPVAYREFIHHLSAEERKDIAASTYSKVMHPNPAIHMDIARALMRYHAAITPPLPHSPSFETILQNDRLILSFMRACVHYAVHRCFLQPNQILSHVQKISHLPGIIIHGTADTTCLPEQSQTLHQHWKRSSLWMVEGGGHSSDDPAIEARLIQATDAMLRLL